MHVLRLCMKYMLEKMVVYYSSEKKIKIQPPVTTRLQNGLKLGKYLFINHRFSNKDIHLICIIIAINLYRYDEYF